MAGNPFYCFMDTPCLNGIVWSNWLLKLKKLAMCYEWWGKYVFISMLTGFGNCFQLIFCTFMPKVYMVNENQKQVFILKRDERLLQNIWLLYA